jgi:hypothetical protein
LAYAYITAPSTTAKVACYLGIYWIVVHLPGAVTFVFQRKRAAACIRILVQCHFQYNLRSIVERLLHGNFSSRVLKIDLCPLDVHARSSRVKISWA